MNIFGNSANVTLFGMWVKTWPEVTKIAGDLQCIADRKITAWSTWGDFCLIKRHRWMSSRLRFAPERRHQHLICSEFLFGLCIFVFFLDTKCYDISKLYPRGLQNTPEHVEVRKELSVRGLQNNKRKHAMGVGRTCALYLVSRHWQNTRKHTNVQRFSTWNKAKSHPQQLCFFSIFSSMKNVYLTTVAWKSLLSSWKKPIKTSDLFRVRKVGRIDFRLPWF